ncbi:hypothetical protein D3C80_2199820 [compost metagenome]
MTEGSSRCLKMSQARAMPLRSAPTVKKPNPGSQSSDTVNTSTAIIASQYSGVA